VRKHEFPRGFEVLAVAEAARERLLLIGAEDREPVDRLMYASRLPVGIGTGALLGKARAASICLGSSENSSNLEIRVLNGRWVPFINTVT